MVGQRHSQLATVELHDAFNYVATSDPGAVGAGKYWLNTSVVPYLLYRRNAGDTAWVSIAVPGSSGEVSASDFLATGLTGLVHQSRLVGASTGGAPSSGTFVQGDFFIDYNAKVWVCTVGGTPGTWHVSGDAGTIDVVMGGSGSVITTGVKGDLRVDMDLQITGWYLYADQSGSITVDIWKTTHASFPATIANTIIGGGGTLPSISASDHSQFVNLTGWTTTIAASSILRFNVNSASAITRATLALQVIRV